MEAGNGSAQDDMAGLVSEIARALVDNAESVVVETLRVGDETVLRLHVAPADVAKIIGKKGRMARSLRTILSATSMKWKHNFVLDIVEKAKGSAS